MKFLFLLFLSGLGVSAHAEQPRGSWDGALYGYFNTMAVREDSVLNPANVLAQLPDRTGVVEARFNLKAENEALRFSARPILLAQQARTPLEIRQQQESYLSQWQLRWKANDTLTLSGGRELLNWGAAQFRSPSSPFYFNNGRSNPMAELSGMDALRLSWSPLVSTSVYMARIAGSGHGHAHPDPWADGWLIKADWRGDETAVGLVVAKSVQQAVFLGGHAQRMVGDEWLLYGEFGSSALRDVLISPADVNRPFAIAAETPRKTDGLAGVAYTFAGGQNLAAEYLRYNHGYDAAENRAYFARANIAGGNFPAGIPTLAMALNSAPPLLGRDYLHLVWQSSPMDSAGFARLMVTHNLTDGSNELAAYGEYTVNTQLNIFALTMVTTGGAQREFARLFNRVFTAGVKVVLP